jgi:hypothetical protein
MQQFIRAGERVLDAELFLQNALCVFAAQSAHTSVTLRRSGLEARDELLLLRDGQFGRRSTAIARRQRWDAAVAIRICPTLNKPTASCELLLNLFRLYAFYRQHDHAIAIPLLRTALCSYQSSQLLDIARRTLLYLHAMTSMSLTHSMPEIS